MGLGQRPGPVSGLRFPLVLRSFPWCLAGWWGVAGVGLVCFGLCCLGDWTGLVSLHVEFSFVLNAAPEGAVVDLKQRNSDDFWYPPDDLHA